MAARVKSSPYVAFLYYYAKIFGLAPLSLKGNRLSKGSLCDRLLPMAVIILYVIVQSILTAYRLNIDDGYRSVVTQIGDTIILQFGLVALLLTVITVWYKANGVLEIVGLFILLRDLLKYFRVDVNYERRLRWQAIIVGISFCVVMISEIQVDVVFLRTAYVDITPSAVIAISISSLVNTVYHFVIVNFVGLVAATTELHGKLNTVLENLLPRHKKSTNHRGARIIDVNQYLPTSNSNSEILFDVEVKLGTKLTKLQGIHNNLRDLMEKIISLFSFPILAVVSYYFMAIVTGCFYVYVDLRSNNGLGNFLSSIMWIIVSLVELTAIAVASSLAQNMDISTARILHVMWIEHHPIEIIGEIQMLSLQLLQRPLTISAFGFFSLDYSYLYKIFCAVVAYFVIMVQLDTSKVDSSQSFVTPNATGTI